MKFNKDTQKLFAKINNALLDCKERDANKILEVIAYLTAHFICSLNSNVHPEDLHTIADSDEIADAFLEMLCKFIDEQEI